MCLISALPKGSIKFSKEVEAFIRAGMHSQRDGSGLMWKKNGKNTINIKKGFFKIEELLSFLDNLSLEKEDELAIHHRTGTQGNNDSPNTHPFLITPDTALCTSLEGEFDIPALMHNGIFRKMEKFDKAGLSDTFSFTNGFLNSKSFILQMLKEDSDAFLKAYEDKISWSKLCIMFPDRDMLITGNFVKDNDYYHSNACYFDWNARDKGGVSTYPKNTGRSTKNFIINNNANLELVVDEEPDFDNKKNLPSLIEDKPRFNNTTNKIVDIVKLTDIHVDLDITNYTNFVYLLKENHSLFGIETVQGYRATNWNDATGLVALYITSEPNYRKIIRISELRSMFYYLPTREFKTIYNDYILLNSKAKVSKTLLKKLEKQVNSKFNKSELEKIRVKSINTFICKAAVSLFIKQHNAIRDKKTIKKEENVKNIALKFNLDEDELIKSKKLFDQETREFSFSE